MISKYQIVLIYDLADVKFLLLRKNVAPPILADIQYSACTVRAVLTKWQFSISIAAETEKIKSSIN